MGERQKVTMEIMLGDFVLCDHQWYEVRDIDTLDTDDSYICITKGGEERELTRDQIEIVDSGPGPRGKDSG